jgi:hypothetical protein
MAFNNPFSDRFPVVESGSDGNATSIQNTPVSATPPTVGQVLQFDGTEWVPVTLPTPLDLTRTVNVGIGIQYEYPNVTQAWNALGSPLNVHVCTDINEDGDIKLTEPDSYLSITHAYNVTVNRSTYSIIAGDVPRVTLKIDGSFATWRRGYDENKASIDFKTSTPEDYFIEIKNLIDFDESNHSSSTPFIVQGQANGSSVCQMQKVSLLLNNNATSTNEFYNANIYDLDLVCNDGRDSDFCLSLAGTSKINGVRAFGDFRSTTALMIVNKYSTYENVYNLASDQVSVLTSGGHGSNLYGVNSVLNIVMLGNESEGISPKVVNANNCSFSFQDFVTASNSAGTITNADVMGVDNSFLTSGNFKFVNCQILTQLTWAGEGQVTQFTSCNFQQGYSIQDKNTVIVNALAGLSVGGSSENIKVDGGEGSIIVATQGNVDFDDPTIGTDDVEEGFNKVLS